jgi:hypothetical protein
MSKKIIDPTRVTASMAEVGLVLSIAFFINIVVTLIRNDEDKASTAAGMQDSPVD